MFETTELPFQFATAGWQLLHNFSPVAELASSYIRQQDCLTVSLLNISFVNSRWILYVWNLHANFLPCIYCQDQNLCHNEKLLLDRLFFQLSWWLTGIVLQWHHWINWWKVGQSLRLTPRIFSVSNFSFLAVVHEDQWPVRSLFVCSSRQQPPIDGLIAIFTIAGSTGTEIFHMTAAHPKIANKLC